MQNGEKGSAGTKNNHQKIALFPVDRKSEKGGCLLLDLYTFRLFERPDMTKKYKVFEISNPTSSCAHVRVRQ